MVLLEFNLAKIYGLSLQGLRPGYLVLQLGSSVVPFSPFLGFKVPFLKQPSPKRVPSLYFDCWASKVALLGTPVAVFAVRMAKHLHRAPEQMKTFDVQRAACFCCLVAQWYPLPFFWGGGGGYGFPYDIANPKKGALIKIGLLGY